MLDFEREQALRRSLQFLYGGRPPTGPGPMVRQAFPSYRVFLFGFEVTEDVTAVTINSHVGKQPNSCTITLLNERDRYIITTEDVFWLTGLDPSLVRVPSRDLGLSDEALFSETMQEVLTSNLKTNEPLDYRLSNPLSMKNQIYFLKQAHSRIDVDVINEDGVVTGSVPRSRYPFADGVPVFHPNDPVRVFVRDPFDANVWYYGFSGLITDMTDDVSKDLQKTLTISCEDPTKLLRYARVTTNPGALDSREVLTAQDEADRSIYTSNIQDKTLPQIIDLLVFGTHKELPPQPESLVLTGGASDDKSLVLAALRAGVLGLSTDVNLATITASDTVEDIYALMSTEDDVRILKAYIAEQRAAAETATAARIDAFQIDCINKYGDVVQKRFGINGVGAFKPAHERSEAALVEETSAPTTEPPSLRERLAGLSDEQIAGLFPQMSAPDRLRLREQWSSASALRGRTPDQQTPTRNRIPDTPATGPHIFSFGNDPAAPFGTQPVSLEEWNNIISWRVSFNDVHRLLSKDVDEAVYRQSLNRKTALNTIEDVITLIGNDPVNFPVDGGGVYMFMPIGAAAVGNEVVGRELLSSIATRTGQFQNRLQLIYDALERIEFIFYCTPKGDLVVEFPLYDFDPRDFGVYERDYICELEDIFTSSSTFSDAAVRTMVSVNVSYFAYVGDSNRVQQAEHPVVVKLPSMFPVYGTRSENSDLKGLIQTEQAARLYGNLYLNRVNADAHSLNLPVVPRFEAGLNRPYLWKTRNHIGTAMSVVHNCQWNGSWRTTIGLSHLRGWTGMLDERGNMQYVPIAGGSSSRTVNYKTLFGRNDTPIRQDINQSNEATAQQQSPADLPAGGNNQ